MPGTGLLSICVFTINFILWACGILLIVFGSIALADPQTIVDLMDGIYYVDYLEDIMDFMPLLEGMAIFMIVLGCFLFLFGGVGCGAGFKDDDHLMMAYWGMLVCAILTEIALIIYACVYPWSVRDWIVELMTPTLLEYDDVGVVGPSNSIVYAADESSDAGWQHLQFETSCCGARDYTDYDNITWYDNNTYPIPLSCCATILGEESPTDMGQITNEQECQELINHYSVKPCSETVEWMLWEFNLIALIIACCLVGIEIIGIGVTYALWRDKRNKHDSPGNSRGHSAGNSRRNSDVGAG